MPHRKSGEIISSIYAAVLVSSAFGQSPPEHQTSGGAPVTLEGRTLFTVRENLGRFSAKDRAAATSVRLSDLAKDLTVPVNAIGAVASGATTDIIARDRVLLTITNADAKAAQLTRDELAASYVKSIRSAVARRREEYSYRSLLTGARFSVLATLILIALMWSVRRIFPAINRRLEASRGA
jgi:hypothetical protein